ncbi:MAG TPA: molybdopterin-dependent oxidoreductase, partial [Propionibacteriaceae bacterium]|nr:molybdopterin-dependent oxidoreductase [Propionibacteriaceae bacterium]
MTATHCPYCALQCAMAVAPSGAVGITPTVTPLEFPTNRGRLCQKGWTAAEVLTASDRLTSPLVRRDGKLVATDWDTALTLVADTCRRLRAEHGPASVAV